MVNTFKIDAKGYTNYARRMPVFPSSSSILKNQNSKANHKLLQDVLTGCQLDQSHILPLWSAMQERKEEHSRLAKVARELRKYTSMGKVNIDGMIEWLDKESDIDMDLLI